MEKTTKLYGVNDDLTRAQMSKILVKAFHLQKNLYEGVIFPDVGQEHWAKEYVQSLYMADITTGNNGYFYLVIV